MKGDADYKEKVEKSKEICQDSSVAEFDQEEIRVVIETGYHTLGNYMCIKPNELEARTSGGATIGDTDIKTDRVLAPLSRKKLRAICAKHPSKPAVEVQAFASVKCRRVAFTLPRRGSLSEEQADVEMKKAAARVVKELPVQFRGNTSVPDLKSLEGQLEGAALAAGEVRTR